MWDRIRERAGSAGLAVAVIALVLAVAGGAYAAGGGLSGKQKKEVEKISKKFAGKPGAPGAAGASGKNGTSGTNGTNGTPGAPGKSVTVKAATTECEGRGGAIVEDEAVPPAEIEVCTGEQGEEGEPWTPNSVLPAGATETGTWAFSFAENEPEGSIIWVPISFPVQLASGLTAEHVHFRTEENFFTKCPEVNASFPGAPEGELCVYQSTVENAEFVEIRTPGGGTGGVAKTGGVLQLKVTGPGPVHGGGTWAVTGFPPPPAP